MNVVPILDILIFGFDQNNNFINFNDNNIKS